MNIAEYLTKKQFGDAKRIAAIINTKRLECGEQEISYGTVRAMLNGNRKISDEVCEVAKVYFEKQQELQTI